MNRICPPHGKYKQKQRVGNRGLRKLTEREIAELRSRVNAEPMKPIRLEVPA